MQEINIIEVEIITKCSEKSWYNIGDTYFVNIRDINQRRAFVSPSLNQWVSIIDLIDVKIIRHLGKCINVDKFDTDVRKYALSLTDRMAKTPQSSNVEFRLIVENNCP